MALSHFVDKESEFRAWRTENPNGYIVNTNRVPSASYLMLHTAGCCTIRGEPARGHYWTKAYSKVCANDLQELEDWAERNVQGTIHPCLLCRPA